MASIKMTAKNKPATVPATVAPITKDKPHPDAAGFTLVVGSEFGTFTKGQQLTTSRPMFQYVEGFIEDEAMAARWERATTQRRDEVLSFIKDTVAAIKTPADSDESTKALLDAIADAKFMAIGLDEIQDSGSGAALFAPNSPELAMMAEGEKVSQETADELTFSVNAKRDYDAGPIILAHNLVARDGVAIGKLSIMGTRKTGSKHDRAHHGFRLPGTDNKGPLGNLPIFPGPYHHYKDANDKTRNAVLDFFLKTPEGNKMQTELNQIRSVGSKQGHLEGTPQEFLELKNDVTAYNQETRDVAAEVTRRVNRYTTAITFLQAKKEFEDKFKYTEKGVTVSLKVVMFHKDTGEIDLLAPTSTDKDDTENLVPVGKDHDGDPIMVTTHERLKYVARKLAPLAIKTSVRKQVKNDDTGEMEWNTSNSFSQPFAIGKLNTLFNKGKVWEFPVKTSAGTLLAQKRKTPEDKNKATGQASGKQASAIKTVGKLDEYLSEVRAFIMTSDKTDTLLSAISKGNKQLANNVVCLVQELSAIAQDSDVIAASRAFIKEDGDARRDADENKDKKSAA